jgi:hypothetical protein
MDEPQRPSSLASFFFDPFKKNPNDSNELRNKWERASRYTEALSLHEKRIPSAADLLARQRYVPQRQL